MEEKYSFKVKKILKTAEKEMFELHHPYVGSEHLILAILKSETDERNILNSYDLYYENFKTNLIKVVGSSRKKSEIALYTPLLKRIISNALLCEGKIECKDLLISMLEEGEGIAIRILLNMDIDLEKLYSELSKKNKNSTSKNLLIYDIGKDLSNITSNDKIFKREEEINFLVEILLRKNKNNPLLIGEAGVGKTAIVEELARRINEKNVPDALMNHKIIELDTGNLISGTRYRGDFEDRLNKIIKEVILEKNIILFIDEVHSLMNCGGAEGAVDAVSILKPYLARGELKIIGATTLKEYKASIFKDKALDRRFQTIMVEEPNLKDTEYILKKIKKNYEIHHNVIISDENIKDIVKYSDKYIFNKYNPDKAIDLMDSVCAHVQFLRPSSKSILVDLNQKKEKLLKQKKYKEALEIELKLNNLETDGNKIQISKEDIIKVIEYKANMPVLDHFNIKLNKLYDVLSRNIYGQDKQLEELSKSLKEKYLIDNSKPLSILIDGPKGVGKTFVAKEIADYLFGLNHFLRLDMSEFSSDFSINKLLGASQGYVGYDDDILLNKVKDYPYSIILLDDIEKSSYKVQELFAKIIENGSIRNNKNEDIYFNNTTIIMTSGANSQSLGFNKGVNSKTNLIIDSLLNKIDKVITFSSIEPASAKKYIKRETQNININKEEIDEIIKNADINKNGIRGLQRELNKFKIHKLMTKV